MLGLCQHFFLNLSANSLCRLVGGIKNINLQDYCMITGYYYVLDGLFDMVHGQKYIKSRKIVDLRGTALPRTNTNMYNIMQISIH